MTANRQKGRLLGLAPWLQRAVLIQLDRIYALIPSRKPQREALSGCRIISHRGSYDNRTCFENTLAAFDPIRDAGVWGIEFDIRWTKDLQPVVFHDASLERLFGISRNIRDLTLGELQSAFAMIPTLRSMIERYADNLHLMVELKSEIFPDPPVQMQCLRDSFEALKPIADYHFLSLNPELFKMIHWAPPGVFLPVAEFNISRISSLSLQKGYGGILGHYLLLTSAIAEKHRNHRQRVGTGFINSRQCLYREVNRGIDWIFSNNAVGLQAICRGA